MTNKVIITAGLPPVAKKGNTDYMSDSLNRLILIEIVIPWLWNLDLAVRWMWISKPSIKISCNYWNVEWLIFDIGGRK